MALAAFGVAAQRYAARFPPELEIVFADETLIGDAFAESVDRARVGRRFFASLAIDEPRSVVAQRLAAQILTSTRDHGARRTYFDALANQQLQINGAPQQAFVPVDHDKMRALAGIIFACDALLVRSWSEFARLRELVQPLQAGLNQGRAVRVLAPPATPVPRFRARDGGASIVIWAADLPASAAAILAFALDELHAPVVVVCENPSEGATFGLRAQFIAPSDVEPYLDGAAVLVDAAAGDPATAVALAASGVPLVTCAASGAYEFVGGVGTYDYWSFRSILQATLMAYGLDPPKLHAAVDGPDVLRGGPVVETVSQRATPLVSIVMPTKNRRAILPRAIESIARQTYPNIELVLVNDGGEPVADLTTALKNVRVIEHEQSLGVTPSVNDGIGAATGEFFAFMSDDDYFFADHFRRMVAVLERTGASVAHAMFVSSHLVPDESGAYSLLGYNLVGFNAADPSELVTYNLIGGQATVYRRRIFEELGVFDLAAKHGSDYELHLRIIARYDYVMVPHIGVNVDFRRDQTNLSVNSQRDNSSILRYLFGKHPVPGRADLEQRRQHFLAHFDRPESDPSLNNPAVPLSVPRPGQYRLR